MRTSPSVSSRFLRHYASLGRRVRPMYSAQVAPSQRERRSAQHGRRSSTASRPHPQRSFTRSAESGSRPGFSGRLVNHRNDVEVAVSRAARIRTVPWPTPPRNLGLLKAQRVQTPSATSMSPSSPCTATRNVPRDRTSQVSGRTVPSLSIEQRAHGTSPKKTDHAMLPSGVNRGRRVSDDPPPQQEQFATLMKRICRQTAETRIVFRRIASRPIRSRGTRFRRPIAPSANRAIANIPRRQIRHPATGVELPRVTSHLSYLPETVEQLQARSSTVICLPERASCIRRSMPQEPDQTREKMEIAGFSRRAVPPGLRSTHARRAWHRRAPSLRAA